VLLQEWKDEEKTRNEIKAPICNLKKILEKTTRKNQIMQLKA